MRRPYLDFLGANGMLVDNIESQVKEVYENAKKAEKEIKALSIAERVKILDNLQKVLIDNMDRVLDAIQAETFKTRVDLLTSEIYGPIDFLNFLKDNAAKALADKKVTTPLALMGKKSLIIKEPMGTVLLICPWNYPFFNAIVQSATTFICGNATIFKPSEVTPLKGLLEDIYEKAGFKKDWIQVIYGDGQVGEKLIDGKPDKVCFTGSVETGKKIMAQAAKDLIPIGLELGGKDPMVVFEDVNIHQATSGALWGGLIASGQSCTSVERLMVHEKVYADFKKLLIEKANKIRVGKDTGPEVEMGPMITRFQVGVIKSQLEDALAKGAKMLTGEKWDKESSEIPPIILEGVTKDMLVWDEESFGPIIPIYSFKTEEEALLMANDSQFGLSISVWSKDTKKCLDFAKKVKTGNVSINNVMLSEGNAFLPFGGTKLSGFGRYKGMAGFDAFSNSKSVIMNPASSNVEAHWFPFTTEKYNLFKKLLDALFKKKGIAKFVSMALIAMKLEGYANKISKK